MTQLVIGGVPLPEVSRDQYRCWPDQLTRQLDMVSGRRTLETIGNKWNIWRISYSYDYMGEELMRMALAVLRGGAPFLVTFLPDNSDEVETSSFVAENISPPSMAFSRRKGDTEKAFWHKIAFSLREEYPHA